MAVHPVFMGAFAAMFKETERPEEVTPANVQ
jgi:hypothetical protein